MDTLLPRADLLYVALLPAHVTRQLVEALEHLVELVFLLSLLRFDFFDLDVEQTGLLNCALAVLSLAEHLLDQSLVELALTLSVSEQLVAISGVKL